jgi:hypothetical protein
VNLEIKKAIKLLMAFFYGKGESSTHALSSLIIIKSLIEDIDNKKCDGGNPNKKDWI